MAVDTMHTEKANTSLYVFLPTTHHLGIYTDTDRLQQPNDEREQDRLDLVRIATCIVNDESSLLTPVKLHHIFLMVLEGELYCAPIPENISQVLDLGTGTGAWAMDLAE